MVFLSDVQWDVRHRFFLTLSYLTQIESSWSDLAAQTILTSETDFSTVLDDQYLQKPVRNRDLSMSLPQGVENHLFLR